jgi:uncharacterized cofD-like protein
MRIVVIGGGTGTFPVLSGLKKYVPKITAIVTMADSGGHSGYLADELGILPPGDIRNSLVALSDESKQWVLRNLLAHRIEFKNGREENIGNLMLAALEEIFGSFEKGIDFLAELLHSHGKVIPVTLTKTKLYAKTEDGKTINGEKNIDIPKTIDRSPIKNIWLKPVPKANPKALQAIQQAEAIIIGPGDLFTSLLPNLLVKGVTEALRKTKGKIIYITNLMTKNGETDTYKTSDLINELEKYLGPKLLDAVIINSKRISKKLCKKYIKEHSEQVIFDQENLQKVPYKIYPANLLTTKAGLIRHDPERLARHILSIVLSLNGKH